MKQMKFTYEQTLTTVLVALCFSYFFAISFFPTLSNNNNIAEIKTALINCLTLIIGYHFGASIQKGKKPTLDNNTETTK